MHWRACIHKIARSRFVLHFPDLKFYFFLRHRYLGEDFQFSGKISLGQVDTVSTSLLSALALAVLGSTNEQLSLCCCGFACIIALQHRTLVRGGAYTW